MKFRNRKSRWVFLGTLALILSPSAALGERPHADAVSVFQCAFGEDWDVNYDRWPDRWVRKTGPDYPHYVSIKIAEDPTAPNERCLRIGLDGAAAAVLSPPIRVMPRFSYLFQAKLKNERLKHSTAVVTLEFCDANGRVLQTTRSEAFSITNGWETVQLGPVAPSDAAIDRVVVGLHVARRSKGDLAGQVSLADVRMSRLPRIAVSTNNPCNVYSELNDIIIRCELSGIPERDPEIRFQLLDFANRELQSEHLRLNGRPIVDDTKGSGGVMDGSGPGPDCYEGSAEWRPKVPDYGFYRVVVRMLSADSQRELASRTIDLAVVSPLAMPRRGEFGWTLPGGDVALPLQDLSRLLPQVGLNWVKVPVWFDANEPQRGDELVRFVELLSASNIEVVGIIDRPPETSELGARVARNAPIADLLSLDSTAWSTSLEPVMSRLSLRVRWWQLGRDYDTSFATFPQLTKRIDEIRTTLFRFGQDVRMGLCWDWANTGAGAKQEASWDFQQMCFESPPTEAEFDALLSKPRENSALRWVLVEPPSRGGDEVERDAAAITARSSDFVRRLISAKVNGADAIIVPNPFNDENGLMSASGMPGELLLPWRTTAAMLSGAEYLGQIRLPAGSENRVFLRPDGQVVMAVWNREPTLEVLNLGKDIRQIDIFGRSTTPAQEGRDQVISVGATPAFVLGLNEAVTRWRMAVTFEKLQVPSVYAKPHGNSIRFRNFFPQGVGGSLKIVVLDQRYSNENVARAESAADHSAYNRDRWTIEPPQGNFQLAAGKEMQFPFEVVLKNALFGKQPVRVDFRVEADELFEFSVYQEMEVGTEDLTLDVHSRLEKDGTLVVEQLMTNQADRLAEFKCFLYARGRLPQRMQVYRLGSDVDRKVYRFPDGSSLVGKDMLLEIEELNGPRILKYRFVATAETATTEATTAPVETTHNVHADKTADDPPANESKLDG